MRFFRARVPTVIAIVLVAGILALLITSKTNAAGFVNISQRPAVVSTETTATFTFSGIGSHECKIDNGAFEPCTSPYTTPTLSVGAHTFTVHVIGETNPEATATHSWTLIQLPSLVGDTTTGSVVDTKVAVSYLQVVNGSDDELTVELSVPSGVLAMAVTSGITFMGAQTGTNVVFRGSVTDVNAALASLEYTPSSTGVKVIDVAIKGTSDGSHETFNGHIYRYVRTATTWDNAKTAAEASTFGGVNGYLANITTSAEHAYVRNFTATGSWLGGSDAALEGDWKWNAGPENNTAFWSGDVNGAVVGGAFIDWQTGQPDNFSSIENCLEMRFVSSGNSWNDESCTSSRGYLIEYGGATLPQLDTAQISVTVISEGDLDGDGIPNSLEVVGPNKDDANDDGMPDHLQANVGSQPSDLTDEYVVVASTCTSHLGTQIGGEAESPKDVAFDYPHGLVGFIGTGCGAPGSTVTVEQYYYGNTLDPSNLTLRKWSNGAYSTIDGAVFSTVIIGGKSALKVVYQVVDGGPLDEDGVADGNINDPVGIGVTVLSAPNTGLGDRQAQPLFIAAVIGTAIAGALVLVWRARSAQK